MKFLLELQSIINEALDFKKEAAKHMKDMHNKNATPAARAYAQKMLQRALEASKMKDKEAATRHYMGVEEDYKEPTDAAKSAKTGIYQTDVFGAKAYHAKCMESNCNWESKRFDRIKEAQAAAEKHAKGHFKQGVAEGFKEPTDIDGITKLLNHVLAHEEDYPMGYAHRLVSALEKAEKKSQPDLGSHYKELRNKLASGSTKMPPMIAKLFSQNQKLFDMASKGKITPELKRIVSTWGESSPWGENTDTDHPEWIDGALEKLLKAYYPVWKENQGLAEEHSLKLKYEPMKDHAGSLLVKDPQTGKILGEILRPRDPHDSDYDRRVWRGYVADIDGKFRSGRPDFTADDVESVKDFFELRYKRDLDEQGLAEDSYEETEQTAVINMFERLVKQGIIDPIDMIVHTFRWDSHDIDQLAKNLGFENSSGWAEAVKQGKGVNEAKGELTYTPKFQTWAVIPKSRRQFVKYFQPHREEEARIFAQNSGGRLVKVDQMGRVIKEGRFTVNARTGAKLHPRTGEELPQDEAPPASISTVSLKTLMQNRRRFPNKSPFSVQDEKIKKYLGEK